jgi:hypothetical protein
MRGVLRLQGLDFPEEVLELIVREQERALTVGGYCIVPLETTDEMRLAVPVGDADEIWRKMCAARPK